MKKEITKEDLTGVCDCFKGEPKMNTPNIKEWKKELHIIVNETGWLFIEDKLKELVEKALADRDTDLVERVERAGEKEIKEETNLEVMSGMAHMLNVIIKLIKG